MPFCTPDASACHNEVEFGFTPHAGATYYLGRLPGELGTYLALTGNKLTGGDLLALDLAESAPGTELEIMLGRLSDGTMLYEYPRESVYRDSGHIGDFRDRKI